MSGRLQSHMRSYVREVTDLIDDSGNNISSQMSLKSSNLYNFKEEVEFGSIEMSPHKLSDVSGYMDDGIFYNLYGAMMVDSRWMMCMYIVARHYKYFQTNLLNNRIDINSLHLGCDSGSVQSSLHHLFNFSKITCDKTFRWNWLSLDKSNAYWANHNTNFIQLFNKDLVDQLNFIMGRIAEKNLAHNTKVNLIIYQRSDDHNRSGYLMCLIVALKCLDTTGMLLIELGGFTQLDLHILALCSLVFHSVIVERYDVGVEHVVAICKKKKSNVSASNVVKKLIKILMESKTDCIVNSIDDGWVERIAASHVEFLNIVDYLDSILEQNLNPL